MLFFEYESDSTPLGFVLNGTQYLYITNNSADVMAIADSTGNILATYSYDEWGEVTVNATGEESLALANLNPLRYRGYYYDNETGYYYLQSRYYDPEICRFLNADLPEYASEQKDETAGINVFVYCCNDPINNCDPDGHKKFNTIDDAALEFAQKKYNISRYIRFEISSLIYGLKKKKKTYYKFTKYIVGNPHNCNPLQGRSRIPKKGFLVAAIHTHPNSNEFSDADRNFAISNSITLYVVTPNGSLRAYRDTRRGYRDVLVESGIIYDSLSKALKAILRVRYRKNGKSIQKQTADSIVQA